MSAPTMSRFLRLALFAAALLSLPWLTGCAGGLFGPAADPVTITFLYGEGVGGDYQLLADEFHRLNPEITVALMEIPSTRSVMQGIGAEFDQVDAVRFSILEAPDSLLSALLPVDMLLTADADFPYQDLYAGSLEALQLNGKQIAIPAGIDPYVMYYNPARLSAAGVMPPASQWTLEDFVLAAMAANRTDAAPGSPDLSYGFCSHTALADPVIFAYLFGGGLADSLTMPARPMLNDPANVEALTWYASLKSDFGLMPPASQQRDVYGLIARSNCAFWMNWLSTSDNLVLADQEAGVLPLPTYKNSFNVINLEAYAIRAKSPNPEATWKWLRFLMGRQEAAGYLVPPLRSLVESPEYARRVPDGVLAAARNQPENTAVLGLELFRSPLLGSLLERFNAAAARVLAGEMDAQTALDEAQRQAEKTIP